MGGGREGEEGSEEEERKEREGRGGEGRKDGWMVEESLTSQVFAHTVLGCSCRTLAKGQSLFLQFWTV